MSFFFYFLATIGNLILRGFVFSRLWEWFVVRQFDVKPMSVTMAIGIGTLITLATYTHIPSRQEQEERAEGVTVHQWGTLIGFTILYLAIWLQGYIVQHFLG